VALARADNAGALDPRERVVAPGILVGLASATTFSLAFAAGVVAVVGCV
jgi:hypothetical protein